MLESFADYLRRYRDRGVADFSIRVDDVSDTFYIHPSGVDGETPMFSFRGTGNELTPLAGSPSESQNPNG